MKKNLVYFGSPLFSAQILDHLIATQLVNVVGVVTTPDKPQGRKQQLTASPVADTADKYNLPIYKPTKLDTDNLSHIKLLRPDLFLFVSYGQIVPKPWLDTPAIGSFNIHFSLLPKYRGALCIQEAIKNLDKETGVTLMVMDEQLDHGPIIDQEAVTIEQVDDVSTLITKLTRAAKDILDRNIPEICAQKYALTPQDKTQATYTASHRSLNHSSAYISWEDIQNAMSGHNAASIHALIRSMTPEPGAWTSINNNEVKILKTSLESNKLVMEKIQLSGKNPITWKQYLSGH